MIDRDKIERIAGSLLLSDLEQEQFITAIQHGACGKKVTINSTEVSKDPKLPSWCPVWVTEGEVGDISGAYTLDLSSVFEASLLQEIPKIDSVLDTCAAPGGKAIFAWRLFKPELLVVNEVDFTRAKRLRSNLERFGIQNVEYGSSQIKNLNGQYQLVLVDAPCSGQSLLARGIEVKGAFNRTVIDRNADRQKRLLQDAAKLVKPDGYCIYMTCAYSRDENEKVIEWFLKREQSFSSVLIPFLEQYRSKITDKNCYRLFPFQNLGAGGFATLLRRG